MYSLALIIFVVSEKKAFEHFPMFFVPVGYSIWLPRPIICSDWLKFQRSSSLKLMNWLNPNCTWMIIGMSFKNSNFVEDHPRNIPAKFGSNRPSRFGEEAWNVKSLQTTDDGRQVMVIESKLLMNDHWNVLYQLSVFYADRKSKMAATAGHRLTLDPMGKCSNAFSLAQWFRRRSLKCEKFTDDRQQDDRRRTPSDGNSSPGPLVQVN
jgi:5-hydroxyisourate hydrolase-like protein (transthyretin family)